MKPKSPPEPMRWVLNAYPELARGCDAIARACGVASGYGQRFPEGHDSGRTNERAHIRF